VSIEMSLWRIQNDRPLPLLAAGIGEEKRLESIIADDVGILGLGPLMLLGRQVATDFGARVDLLAIDEDGTTYIIELKRGRTPREVVAQVLDYGGVDPRPECRAADPDLRDWPVRVGPDIPSCFR
jgi:hypothetical protein